MKRAACILLARTVRNEAAVGLHSGSAARPLPSCTSSGSVGLLNKYTPPNSVFKAAQFDHGSRLFHKSTLDRSHAKELTVGVPDKLYSLVEVECRSSEPAVLRSYHTFVTTAAGHLEIPLQEVLWPKKHIQRWTLLKSVHIYKKHRVQYEVRTHFLIMKFARLTGSTADTFLEYIQRNLPEGVSMKVTKHELQKLPEHVKPSSEVVV